MAEALNNAPIRERPDAGACRDCGASVIPVWIGIGKRPGWHAAERCLTCQTAQEARREKQRRQRQRNQLLAARIERSRMTGEQLQRTFASFRPRQGAEEALYRCQDLVRQWGAPDLRGLILAGTNGCGKTHLAQAIVNEFLHARAPATAMFITMSDYLEGLRQMFRRVAPDDTRWAVRSVALLVLDDIGAPAIREGEEGDWIREEVSTMLDVRNDHHRPIVVTLDETQDVIERRLGKRVISRLFGMSDPIPITADDYRMRTTLGEE